MAELQPLGFEPIERVTEERAEPALERMLTGQLPAFIVHHTTYDRNWLPTYRQTLTKHGFEEQGMQHRHFGVGSSTTDLGWHNDGEPTPNMPVHVVHDHITAAGHSLVKLAIPKPNRDLSFEEKIAVAENLKNGDLIDPEVYESTGLIARLQPGNRLFFVARGFQPLMHSFVTLEGPRDINVRVLRKGY